MIIGPAISPYSIKTFGGVAINPTIATWVAGLSVPPSAGLLTKLSTLFDTLDGYGITSKLDLFHPFALMETTEQRLTPIVSTSGNIFINVNGCSFDANGVVGDGATSYIDTKYNPVTNGVKFTLNDCCMGVWMKSVSDGAMASMGNADFGVYTTIIPKLGGQHYMALNHSPGWVNYATTPSDGCYAIDRSSSTKVNTWVDGVNTVTDAPQNSVIVPAQDFFVCALNNGGGAGFMSTNKVAIIYAGGSLNQTNMHLALSTYLV